MTDDSLLPFDLPSVQRKKVSAAFDGGLISSDGDLVLLREVERHLGLAETLAGCIRDRRNQVQIVHALSAMLRFRMLAIACGYEDADDCDALRADPAFKMAPDRAPESGRALCSQPTTSRLENTPSRIEVARMTAALVDLFCRSFSAPPAAVTLDIDDTCDAVRWTATSSSRSSTPVTMSAASCPSTSTMSRAASRWRFSRARARRRRGPRFAPSSSIWSAGSAATGRTPGSVFGETVTAGARRSWPGARRTASTTSSASPAIARSALSPTRWPTTSRYAAPRPVQTGCAPSPTSPYAARSWGRKRRVVARLEASTRGFDARYIVTSLGDEPRHPYEDIYCARGQAENLIKMHKGQLASDRTPCQSPLANQVRLVLHTAAYWPMLALRDAIPRTAPLARAEFATLRLRLIKIGARVVEKATRVRIHFTSACPDAALFRLLAGRLAAAGP